MKSASADDPDIPARPITTEFGIKLVIKASTIHAVGVYSGQFITAGTRIIEYLGEKISRAEELRRERANELIGATYIFQLDDEFSLDGSVGGNESHFINHSCTPNCIYRIISGHIYIYALTDIRRGEELTYDYAFDPYPDDPVVCNCGSEKCRGTINLPA